MSESMRVSRRLMQADAIREFLAVLSSDVPITESQTRMDDVT